MNEIHSSPSISRSEPGKNANCITNIEWSFDAYLGCSRANEPNRKHISARSARLFNLWLSIHRLHSKPTSHNHDENKKTHCKPHGKHVRLPVFQRHLYYYGQQVRDVAQILICRYITQPPANQANTCTYKYGTKRSSACIRMYAYFYVRVCVWISAEMCTNRIDHAS